MKSRTGLIADWSMTEDLRLYRDAIERLIRISGEQSFKQEEDDRFITDSLIRDVCKKCPRFRDCFGEEGETLDEIRFLSRLLMKEGRVSREDVSPGFRRKCIYFASIMEEMFWLGRLAYQNRCWVRKMDFLKKAVNNELTSSVELLDQCIGRMESPRFFGPGKILGIRRKLLREGAYLRRIRALTGKEGTLTVYLDLRLFWTGKRKGLEEIVSDSCDRRMSCQCRDPWIPPGSRKLQFVEEAPFHVSFGEAHASRKGEGICGDTFSCIQPGQQLILSLADGMGSGQEAFESSSRLIEAFEGMILAGMPEEEALHLLHAVMLLESGEGQPALDIAAVSLRSGLVRFFAAGGAAVFVLRGGQVERICQNSIPLGYLDESEAAVTSRKLYDGDMIVMVSDGMLTFENDPEKGLSMENILLGIHTKNAQTFADLLLKAVPAGVDGYEDDRTVLVAVLWEKEHRK
ncbi:MAG: SpoIIE family protein phosphatase [Eubacterium sp.]|nr:SpoIIE family protein phosphatase [Eubacterium sp.]